MAWALRIANGLVLCEWALPGECQREWALCCANGPCQANGLADGLCEPDGVCEPTLRMSEALRTMLSFTISFPVANQGDFANAGCESCGYFMELKLFLSLTLNQLNNLSILA